MRTNAIVYLVDDEFAVRDSLALLIESTGQAVIGFESAEAFLDAYNPEQPGCLLLDVRMPSMSGLELQEELARKGISIPIIFISGNASIPDSAKAFRAGAVDFLEKPFDNKILLDHIKEALKKDLRTREQLIEKLALQKMIDQLTTREKDVLRLIINSYSSKESAQLLNISKRTIDVHRAHIMEKMQAENLAELVIKIMRCEMI